MRLIRVRNLIYLVLLASGSAYSQSINSGTVTGIVTDQSGAVISHAGVQIRNPVTGYEQSVKTDNTGAFRFNNIPQNPYQLTVTADRFAPANQGVDVRGSLPITVNITLKVAAEITSVDVAASGASVESDPSAHQDVDRSSFLKLPTFNPGSGLTRSDHLQHRRRGGRRQRLLPSAGRSRASQFCDRRPADQRPAEQAVFDADPAQRTAEHGTDHRHAGRAVWRQDQPDRERAPPAPAWAPQRHSAPSSRSGVLSGRGEARLRSASAGRNSEISWR